MWLQLSEAAPAAKEVKEVWITWKTRPSLIFVYNCCEQEQFALLSFNETAEIAIQLLLF